MASFSWNCLQKMCDVNKVVRGVVGGFSTKFFSDNIFLV